MKNFLSIILIFSFFFFLFSFFFSCEKVNPPAQIGGDLEEIQLSDLEHIPLEFGELVSVTSPQVGTAHLWFQDDNSTIRVVQVNYGRNKMSRVGWIIKRK